MPPLGETVVEVVAHTQKAERDLVNNLRRAGREAGRAVDQEVRNQTRLTGQLNGRRIGRNLNAGIRETMRDGIGGGGRGGWFRGGRRAGNAFSRGFNGTTRRRLRFTGDVLKWLGIGAATLATLPTAVTGFSSLASALISAAGAAVAFSTAIAPAAGILTGWPAALAGVTAAAGTLALAFRGIETAITEALSGTTEDFNESLEDLAPEARTVMRELRSMRGVFDDLQDSVQGAAFDPLVGQLDQLAAVVSGPLQSGMTSLAEQIGQIGSTLVDFAASDRAATAITAVFDALTNATRAARSGLEPALRGIADAVIALAPQIEDLGEELGAFLTDWGENLQRAAETGALEEAFENALDTLDQMWTIAQHLLSTFYSVGSAIEDAFGGDLLGSLEQATRRLRDWVRQPMVQLGISSLFIDLRTAIQNLMPAFGELASGVADFVQALADATASGGEGLASVISGIADGLAALARGAGEFLGEAGPELGNLLREIGRALGDLLAGAGPDAARGFQSLADALGEIDWERTGENLGAFFSALAEVVEDLAPLLDKLLALTGVIVQISDKLAQIQDFGASPADTGDERSLSLEQYLNRALVQVGIWLVRFGEGVVTHVEGLWIWFQVGLDKVGQFFNDLGSWIANAPGRLWNYLLVAVSVIGAVFSDFGSGIASAPGKLWTWLLLGLNVLGAIFAEMGSGIVEAVGDLWNWLGSILNSVGAFFSDVGSGINSGAVDLWDWLGSILNSVGGFFSDIGSGINSAAVDLWEWLQSILNTVEGFFNDIGSGIASLAGKIFSTTTSGPWPDWLGAAGGIVRSPTNAVIGEAGPEAVIPLRRPRRAAELLQQSGLDQLLAPAAPAAVSGPRRSGSNGGPVASAAPSTVHAPITVHTAATDPDIVAMRVASRLGRQVRV